MRVLRQAWWAPIAALVGVAELALSPIALT
jgi:hypothetical protein